MSNNSLRHIRLHSEAEEIKAIILNEGFPYLYHFTDIQNLTTVGIYGLLTKAEIERLNLLNQVTFGGNELSKSLDIKCGNWDKVSLSWLPKMPMAYSREMGFHLCYLIFDSSLALAQGVVFTDMNATDNNHKRDEGKKGLSLVNFNSVRSKYPYPNVLVKKQKQAEILIPFSIPLDAIKAVAFRSEASLRYGQKICRRDSPAFMKKFVTDKSIFHLPTPYISKYSISGISIESIDRNKLDNWLFTEKLNFELNEDACIILEIKNLTPGVSVTVIIGTIELFSDKIFRGGSTTWTYTELPTSSPGKFIVEVLIDDIENSTTQFFETIEVN